MEIVNLLEFLNSAKSLYALEYAGCNKPLLNFLDLMTEDEQLTLKIDLGIMYISRKDDSRYIIADGLKRILSLSLLLHAVCECYKKTSAKNDSAIKKIRRDYLFRGDLPKLRLAPSMQEIYTKIINGEPLSGKEKESSMFILLHNFWTQIKEEKLQASKIFAMLKKISVILVEIENVPLRELYYTLNKNSKDLNQFLLIEDYFKCMGLEEHWHGIVNIFNPHSSDLELFFKDFFVTKFNFKEFNLNRLYETFINYFETMLHYMPEDILTAKIKHSAELYNNILTINIENEEIKNALIQIRMHGGEDTYAYILDIYEDYTDNNISETTFLEILSTINEYLKKREKTPNNVTFNELINYLNTFITCK